MWQEIIWLRTFKTPKQLTHKTINKTYHQDFTDLLQPVITPSKAQAVQCK